MRVAQENWSTSRALGHGPESPGRAVQQRRHWNTAPGPMRHVVELAGHRSLARVLQDSWSTLQAIGPKPDCPGELVNPADPQTRARVTLECSSILQDLGPGPELPGAAG